MANMLYSEQVALITGANKGIGFETARQLGQQGIVVLIGARDEGRGRKAVETLKQEEIKARLVALDVTAQSTIDAAAAQIDRDFGRLDILINNAGIGLQLGPASKVGTEHLRTTLNTNLFGAFAVTKAFLPLLRKANSPRIVNVSSTLGSIFHLSDPEWIGYHMNFVSYSISKAALNAMTVLFAAELRDTPIKVNAVEPGYTATDLTNHQGFQTTQEAVKVILKFATIPDDGPTGGYFDISGRMPW